MLNETELEKLRATVVRFRVCWEARPEWSRIGSERKQTAVVVELFGTHDEEGVVPTAGCRHCIPVLQGLLSIAEAILPDAWRDAVYGLRAHSGIQYAAERAGRPDIVVTITLAPDDPADFPRCRDAVVSELTRLGAAERSWPDVDPSSRS